MKATVGFALITLALAVSSASAQDAKGWFNEDCDGATFHFTKVSAQKDEQTVVFFFRTEAIHFRSYPTGSDWREAYGQRCSATGECEAAVAGKMQFQERGRHTVSGKYAIDFRGEHLEGEFRVKERHLKHPVRICE